jgi:hypothetical protein
MAIKLIFLKVRSTAEDHFSGSGYSKDSRFPTNLQKVLLVQPVLGAAVVTVMDVSVATRSKVWACGCFLAGIAGSNLAGAWMSVCCDFLCAVRGPCVGLITRPREF